MSDLTITGKSDDVFHGNSSATNDNVDNKDYNSKYNAGVLSDIDKQIAYDRLLTYRRRMARLSAVQALYLFHMKNKMKASSTKNDLFHTENHCENTLLVNDALSLCQDVIYFYKNVFFTPQEYGSDKRHRKIDESFMYQLVKTAIDNVNIIDKLIASKLSVNWTVAKLDNTILSIVRCAIAEIISGNYVEKAVLSSEYTNIASDFFNGKEIGFINSITDKLYDVVIKKYPFSKK